MKTPLHILRVQAELVFRGLPSSCLRKFLTPDLSHSIVEVRWEIIFIRKPVFEISDENETFWYSVPLLELTSEMPMAQGNRFDILAEYLVISALKSATPLFIDDSYCDPGEDLSFRYGRPTPEIAEARREQPLIIGGTPWAMKPEDLQKLIKKGGSYREIEKSSCARKWRRNASSLF